MKSLMQDDGIHPERRRTTDTARQRLAYNQRCARQANNKTSRQQQGTPVEKIWLNSYPPGVPAEVEAPPWKSVRHLFEQSFEKFPDNPAFINMGRTTDLRRTGPAVDAVRRLFAERNWG